MTVGISQAADKAFVKIEKVTKTFAGIPAVNNVSIDIGKGEYLTRHEFHGEADGRKRQ